MSLSRRAEMDPNATWNTCILNALFPSVRRAVLEATLTQPDRWWYLSELADQLGTRPSSLQREIPALWRAGILEQCRRQGRVYFRAERNSPVYHPLLGLFTGLTRWQPALFGRAGIPVWR